MDEQTEHALALFSETMWGAVHDEQSGNYPQSRDVRRAYSHMKLIEQRLAEHFRNRMGLKSQGPDPLWEVELLGACRVINSYHFSKFNLPTKGVLDFSEISSAEEVVAIARENVSLLMSELLNLKQAANSQDRSFFFDTIARVDRYLERIGNCQKMYRAKA